MKLVVLFGFLCLCVCASAEIAHIEISRETTEVTETSFDVYYSVLLEKVGLGPGMTFELRLYWNESIICIPAPWYMFSQTYFNGTDVIYVPRTVLHLPIQTGVACPDSGIFGMNNDSAIWTVYDVATVEQTEGNEPLGQITLGLKDTRAFANLQTPQTIIPCDIFPTQCWVPGKVNGKPVRVFVKLGSTHVELGSDLWNTQLNDDNSLTVDLDDGTEWVLNGLQQTKQKFITSLAERISPYLLFSPEWTVMKRTRLQPLEFTMYENFTQFSIQPNDIYIGTIFMGFSVILDYKSQHLEVGPRYERANWTFVNILFLLLLMIVLLQQYFNPVIRFPPFLNHDKTENYLNLSDNGSVLSARSWARVQIYNQATQSKTTEERLTTIFIPETFVFEYIGVAVILITILFNFIVLDFTVRVQFLFVNRLERTALFDDVAFWIVFTVCCATLLITHFYFIFMTPPFPKQMRHPLLMRRPMLILLIRRYVYEAEISLAIWVTLLEGPLHSYYQFLIFLNATFIIYSNSVYLITYIYQLRIHQLWLVTASLVTVYILHSFLIVTFMLYPVFIIMWPDEKDTVSPVLFALCTFLTVCVMASTREFIRIVSEIEYFVRLEAKQQKIINKNMPIRLL